MLLLILGRSHAEGSLELSAEGGLLLVAALDEQLLNWHIRVILSLIDEESQPVFCQPCTERLVCEGVDGGGDERAVGA